MEISAVEGYLLIVRIEGLHLECILFILSSKTRIEADCHLAFKMLFV